MDKDLFGNEIVKNPLLRDKFIEPPFSVLNSQKGHWQTRVKKWKRIGIVGHIGRDAKTKNGSLTKFMLNNGKAANGTDTSIFDPALAEIIYHWFCPPGGSILDPFSGGACRGIVANYLGFKYTGIDVRQEQIDANRDQCMNILSINNQPQYYTGDSNILLNDKFNNQFDLVFTCPPYTSMEVYSDLPGDISNMPYKDFLISYKSILQKAIMKLNHGCFVVLVVGEVRDKKGNMLGFVPDTIKSCLDIGLKYYNEIIYLQGITGACLTAGRVMGISKKVKKIHQNVLVFKKI